MAEIARDAGEAAAALKATQRWWVVVIEGIAALVIGIVVLLRPADANDVIRVLIAVGLLIVSAGQIVEGFRFWSRAVSPWATLAGSVGFTAAGLALLSAYSPYIQPAGARQMLAVGLVAFGVIGLFSLIFTLRSTGFKVASVIIDLLAIALGVLLYMAEVDSTQNILLLGVAAVVGGVLLLLYGYYLWNKGRAVAA
jgi:uncharacterized membrane protein HdeD (DUF308 family)